MKCLNCGSEAIEWIEGQYGSGVFAPDGYEERLWAQGWKCADCGALEDKCEEPEDAQ